VHRAVLSVIPFLLLLREQALPQGAPSCIPARSEPAATSAGADTSVCLRLRSPDQTGRSNHYRTIIIAQHVTFSQQRWTLLLANHAWTAIFLFLVRVSIFLANIPGSSGST
jgi:hypothetical protein